MRKFSTLMVSFGVVVLGTTWALAQQPFGGRFGGGGQSDPLALLRNEQVRKELDVTEEQVEQLPDAVMKALKGVLNEKQVARLKQIELQQRGSQAFRDKHVQQTLKMTDEQVTNINTILDDSRKEMAEMFKGGRGGFNKETLEKVENMRKETTEKVQGVLSSDQRKAYKQMLGEEFKLERPMFRGFGNKNKAADE
jgi:hypothetical protein